MIRVLLHLVPKFYNPYKHVKSIKLLSITIPDMNVSIDGKILRTVQHPENKSLYIAKDKSGNGFINGILIELPTSLLKKFYVVYEWSYKVRGTQVVRKHIITNYVKKLYQSTSKNQLLSHDVSLWKAFDDFPVRWPHDNLNKEAIDIEPLFDLGKGWIGEQYSYVYVPTLEVERLQSIKPENMPSLVWSLHGQWLEKNNEYIKQCEKFVAKQVVMTKKKAIYFTLNTKELLSEYRMISARPDVSGDVVAIMKDNAEISYKIWNKLTLDQHTQEENQDMASLIGVPVIVP